jgi:membrane protease subunit (stomatin/prohibitin family)
MGLIQAAIGSLGGALADQWKDFYTIPTGISPTAAIVRAEKQGTDSGRGSNTSGSQAVITNGSKFVVPEGYGLILIQDGAFTGFVSEPGAYIWDSESPDSKSVFAGSGVVESLVKASWERFKFGGRPQSEQLAVYVSLQELGNNRFGTISNVYWDDSYLNSQVGAQVKGTYSLKIVDPISFVKNFVPNNYLQNGATFDFTDLDNSAAQQLFNEVVGSLAGAFSRYANAGDKQNRISKIQQDSLGFGASLFEVLDSNYKWESQRGLKIVSTAIVSIDYDEASKAILELAQRADALSGSRGNSNLQASVAAGIEAAGSTEGASGILGIGLASGSLGLGNLQQPQATPDATKASSESVTAKLQELKMLLDTGLITQADFDAAKAKHLGI